MKKNDSGSEEANLNKDKILKELSKEHEFSLREYQNLINEWIENNGGYWPPLAMLASITEELGETAREINHIEKIKLKKKDEPKNNLEVELGDLLFSISCVANYYKIDLNNALRKSIKKFTERDWNRFKDKSKGQNLE
ncbi:MAG: nucleotide pyrophosphohydrolase [Promethearchaeota archaeon]